ncbi:Glycosyltransferase involved in cell wall bisynthesis [Alteromonadaceae bacterium Bs31]|nr:Glycosyltransferase involved in cell wall bisynthesis [Alteromonadaceae bacterium Bs31]
MKVSFLIPGDNRSGGVRVTAIMAEMLRNKGYGVRIICVQKPKRLVELKKKIERKLKGIKDVGWLFQFKGEIVHQSDLSRLTFDEGEVVVSVGTYTVEKLLELPDYVNKLRYNHGFPAVFDDQAKRVWALDYPSITVSQTLVAGLEELSPNSVMGVVPNGIDTSQYYDLGLERNSIGLFYSRHPNKAPDFIVRVAQAIHQKWPDINVYIVSTQSLPEGLGFVKYLQYPPVEKINEIYNRCRLWILPSDTEGLPGPVLEAQSCGTVIVTTDNDGSLEVVKHDLNGLIAPRRDLDGILEQVERAYFDEEVRVRLAAEGFQTARDYTWAVALEKMEAVLAKFEAGGKQG